MSSNRSPYHGTKRRLVLAFDLGTTYSGVSYAVLDPGKVPRIQTVSRSVLFYQSNIYTDYPKVTQDKRRAMLKYPL
jgi:hypothetical protein